MSYYIVKLVVFSLFIFLNIESLLNIMAFNIVTRSNALDNVSARKLGSKRSFTCYCIAIYYPDVALLYYITRFFVAILYCLVFLLMSFLVLF